MLSDLWEEDVMVLFHDIRAGTTKASARARVALGHHGVPCEVSGSQ